MAKRLTDKEKKEIIAYYTECQNYSEVARKFNVNDKTVKKLITSQDNKEMVEKSEQKKKENTESVLQAMGKSNTKKIKLLDKILDAIDNKVENIDVLTNVKDLATAYGIIIDKELKMKEIELKEKELKDKNDSSQETLERLDEVLNKIGGVV